MLRKYYSVFGPALRILDVFILTLCWMTAYYFRKHYPLSIMQTQLQPFYQYWPYAIVIALLWGAVFSFSGLYSGHKIIRRTAEAYKVLRAHILSLLIFVSLTYLVSTYKLSRGIFLYFGFTSGFLLIFSRVALRNALRHLHTKGFHLQKVILLGTGKTAIQTYSKLKRHPELGLRFLGCVGNSKPTENFLPYLGSTQELENIIQTYHPDKIIVALARNESALLEPVLNTMKDDLVDLILVPDIYEYVALGCEVEDFDGLPMVSLNETPIVGFNLFLKRLTDLIFASLAILFFSPIMIVLTLLIRCTSRGPVFYRQERMSINGTKFDMLKFRSMVQDHSGDNIIQTQDGDPRVTWIGKLMRKTSLDELPQFFNVLLGHMSLVGPRPERTWVVDQVRSEIPRYMLKHKVKAGITGWAQVNGWRGDTSLEKRIEHDLYYIKHWSLLFDLKIMLLTVVRGLINKNAY